MTKQHQNILDDEDWVLVPNARYPGGYEIAHRTHMMTLVVEDDAIAVDLVRQLLALGRVAPPDV